MVHTNNYHLANQTFGPWRAVDADERVEPRHGEQVRFVMAGTQTPVLGVLHELIFCCKSLVLSTSSLSSVVGLATHAEAVYAHTKSDMHFGFRYQTVSI